jgi:hypothetical protein
LNKRKRWAGCLDLRHFILRGLYADGYHKHNNLPLTNDG